SAQALYARAFYASGDTLTPMVASTLIVIASLPAYATLFDRFGFTGLAMASGIGILLHTVVIAWLLHYRKLVPLNGLPWHEVIKAVVTAVVAALLSSQVSRWVGAAGVWRHDILSLAVTGITWLAAFVIGLWMTGSRLGPVPRGRPPVAN